MLKFIKISIATILLSILVIIGLYLSILGFLYVKYPAMDCENENSIFQEYTYDSEEYQWELIKLLKESDFDETRFWFGKYIDPSHITIKIQNENICATALVTVHKLEGRGSFMNNLMAVKGKSYGGPLLGVKFYFDDPEIILAAVDDIVD